MCVGDRGAGLGASRVIREHQQTPPHTKRLSFTIELSAFNLFSMFLRKISRFYSYTLHGKMLRSAGREVYRQCRRGPMTAPLSIRLFSAETGGKAPGLAELITKDEYVNFPR